VTYYGTEIWDISGSGNIWKIFEKWFWGKTEKISWTDRVRDEGMLHRVNEYGEISNVQIKEGRPNGLVTSCSGPSS
jgi:hypothetical protein